MNEFQVVCIDRRMNRFRLLDKMWATKCSGAIYVLDSSTVHNKIILSWYRENIFFFLYLLCLIISQAGKLNDSLEHGYSFYFTDNIKRNNFHIAINVSLKSELRASSRRIIFFNSIKLTAVNPIFCMEYHKSLPIQSRNHR